MDGYTDLISYQLENVSVCVCLFYVRVFLLCENLTYFSFQGHGPLNSLPTKSVMSLSTKSNAKINRG